jgi:hypothetical protein
MDHDQKFFYAGLYVLKKMDLKPEDGGEQMPVLLPSELSPLEDVLQELVNEELIEIPKKGNRYALTKKGLAYLGELIDEAEAIIEEFDDAELEEAVAELRARRLDVFRARFLWGWYDGEFDDLVKFQQRRGIVPIEKLWAFYLMSDAFYDELAKDIGEPSR